MSAPNTAPLLEKNEGESQAAFMRRLTFSARGYKMHFSIRLKATSRALELYNASPSQFAVNSLGLHAKTLTIQYNKLITRMNQLIEYTETDKDAEGFQQDVANYSDEYMAVCEKIAKTLSTSAYTPMNDDISHPLETGARKKQPKKKKEDDDVEPDEDLSLIHI